MSGQNLTDLCGDLMSGLRQHKQETGSDPWPAMMEANHSQGKEALESDGKNLDEILDSFDDMVDMLMGDTTAAGGAPQATADTKDDTREESLEDLVALAMKQLRETGLPTSSQTTATKETEVTVQDLELPNGALDELDALGDLLGSA